MLRHPSGSPPTYQNWHQPALGLSLRRSETPGALPGRGGVLQTRREVAVTPLFVPHDFGQ